MGEVVVAFGGAEAVQQRPDPAPGGLNGVFGRVVETLQPLDRRRRTDPKPPRRRPPTQALAFHGINHAIPQILGIGAGHRLPPSAVLPQFSLPRMLQCLR